MSKVSMTYCKIVNILHQEMPRKPYLSAVVCGVTVITIHFIKVLLWVLGNMIILFSVNVNRK